MRPKQWIKNIFVFTGLIFGGSFYNQPLFFKVSLAALSFCFTSSSIYIINDLIDIDIDRGHPIKKYRPLACGQVGKPLALVLSFFCALIGLFIAYQVSLLVLEIIGAYLLLNLAYSLRLKNVVILDVFCISAGFMLRILAGTVGVGIPPSKWLLLCGLLMTLFLGFIKRRAELFHLKEVKGDRRYVLQNYDAGLLDSMSTICASGVIIGYSLYTMSPDTVRLHGTENLMYTVPFVIYAIFRYLYLTHIWGHGGDPTLDIVKDKHILISVFGWVLCTIYFLHR